MLGGVSPRVRGEKNSKMSSNFNSSQTIHVVQMEEGQENHELFPQCGTFLMDFLNVHGKMVTL